MEVTYDFFTLTDAQHALQEMYSAKVEPKAATNLCKIKKEFDKLFREVSIKGQAIMFKYAELDEEKRFIIDKTNEHGIKFKDGMYEAARKEIDEFLKTKVSIPHLDPIPLGLWKDITANNLSALAPILSGHDLEVAK